MWSEGVILSGLTPRTCNWIDMMYRTRESRHTIRLKLNHGNRKELESAALHEYMHSTSWGGPKSVNNRISRENWSTCICSRHAQYSSGWAYGWTLRKSVGKYAICEVMTCHAESLIMHVNGVLKVPKIKSWNLFDIHTTSTLHKLRRKVYLQLAWSYKGVSLIVRRKKFWTLIGGLNQVTCTN